MARHMLNDDRIMWPTEDLDEEERTIRTFPVPDVPPIVVPDL